jgi:hypothetical protein
MLYGGVLQTSVLLWLLLYAATKSLRAQAEGRAMFVWLLLNTAFLTISSNSVFSSELMMVTLVLCASLPSRFVALSRKAASGFGTLRPVQRQT